MNKALKSVTAGTLGLLVIAWLSGCGSGSGAAVPAVSLSLSQPSAGQLTVTIGTAYSLSLGSGGTAPFTWKATSGTLPAGLTLNASANTGSTVISGTPTNAATDQTVTVQVTDATNQSASVTLVFTVAIVITTGTTLPSGEVAQAAYSSGPLTAMGGSGTFTQWSVTGGNLPSGLSISGTTTGAITGSPAATCTCLFTVQVKDSAGATGTQQFSITVVQQVAIAQSGGLSGGTVGTAYSTTLTAGNGVSPYSSWTVSAGALPAGLTLGAGTGVIAGTPSGGSEGTYNFSVTVKDSLNVTSAPVGLTIVITAVPLSITTTSLPSATVGVTYDQAIQTSGGDGTAITFALATGTSLPAWATLNTATGHITGTPAAGDAGTSTPFQITATQTGSVITSGSLTITVVVNTCGSGSESLLNAGYAFVFKGFDSSGNPALIGGVLTFNGINNGGLITSGAIDENLAPAPNINLAVTSGTYSVGSDHRGCMTITTSAGTMNFRFSLGNITAGVAATVHVIDFDASGPFVAGVMRKQSGSSFSSASANGSFAFGGSSIQNSALCNSGTGTQICGGKFAVAGVLVFNGLGSITGGSEDINQNGFLDGTVGAATWPASSPITISSGSSYTIATNGRGTLTLSFVGIPNLVHAVVYLVSSTELLFMSRDLQTSFTIIAGEALKQSGSPFTATSLSGAYSGYSSALGGTAGTSAVNLILVNIANPNITGTSWQNKGGTFNSGSVNATYTVAANGRVLTTGGGNPPVLYIANANQAFFLSSNGRVESGFFESQTGGPFSNTSASGVYAFGTLDPEDKNVSDNSGVANFASPNVSTTEDDNSNGSLTVGGLQSLTYSIDSTTGLGGIPQGCTISAASTTCQSLFLIVSPTKAVVMDAATTTPKVQIADQ